ncbi:tetratricopeptide repeat protein [Seonamhaeicola aphaedonensis]|uniref:Tetratricopeptide repeat protein n=1 Tax=Seonamhaeicola aphaedonensis TaxID=1461338 RepID=A0A3D9HH98_9FLAO|nr:tetratricopeptide repeat protein [Seonamhaeicola aphaedonensis]RED48755.1 tetratricopeptide repeat protein [Seonamhaeicola aphaedonensis]
MKRLVIIVLTLFISVSFAQKKEDKEQLLALKKANNYVYEGNNLVKEDDFVEGEATYRKALSENPNSVEGHYNLGNAYYIKGNYEEALYRHQQVVNKSASKAERHKAFHNIGNILMQNKKCSEAVEAFKSALRNDTTDDETRYNLALAKECAKDEKQNKDQNEDDKNNEQNKEDQENQEDNKDQKDKEKNEDGENKEQENDNGEQKEKEGDNKEDDQGKPKDEKEDNGKQGDEKDDEKKQPPKPQQGKMSPQQIKNLLEAMNNQEQKVQEKMNAEKQKGIKVKTDKDW